MAGETFEITWTRTETHSATVDAEQLAELLGIDVADINPDDPEEGAVRDIEDSLAEIEGDDTFDGCGRDEVAITVAGDGEGE